jgi:hypothetical protein
LEFDHTMPAAQHPQEKQRGALLCWPIGWQHDSLQRPDSPVGF